MFTLVSIQSNIDRSRYTRDIVINLQLYKEPQAYSRLHLSRGNFNLSHTISD